MAPRAAHRPAQAPRSVGVNRQGSGGSTTLAVVAPPWTRPLSPKNHLPPRRPSPLRFFLVADPAAGTLDSSFDRNQNPYPTGSFDPGFEVGLRRAFDGIKPFAFPRILSHSYNLWVVVEFFEISVPCRPQLVASTKIITSSSQPGPNAYLLPPVGRQSHRRAELRPRTTS